jgi:hypothetical protein
MRQILARPVIGCNVGAVFKISRPLLRSLLLVD